MSGRATTNLLLALIAGVLLFGQTVMVGIPNWFFLALACLTAVYLAVRVTAWAVRGGVDAVNEVIITWKGDASPYEKWASGMSLVMMPFFAWFAGTVG